MSKSIFFIPKFSRELNTELISLGAWNSGNRDSELSDYTGTAVKFNDAEPLPQYWNSYGIPSYHNMIICDNEEEFIKLVKLEIV